MNANAYIGSELTLFAEARNWKSYWASQVAQYVGGSVLEVGAGNGNNTLALRDSVRSRWVCLEPDLLLCRQLKHRAERCTRIEIAAGTLDTISESARFDTILYLDVLEHIELDSRELARSVRILNPGGHLIVLGPAHQWLYSPFDNSIGHFRRYTCSTLRSVAPIGLTLVKCRYLDCAGLATSAVNALFLKQSMPSRRQILFWDRFLVPLSRYIDPMLIYACGKSVLGIWRNNPHE